MLPSLSPNRSVSTPIVHKPRITRAVVVAVVAESARKGVVVVDAAHVAEMAFPWVSIPKMRAEVQTSQVREAEAAVEEISKPRNRTQETKEETHQEVVVVMAEEASSVTTSSRRSVIARLTTQTRLSCCRRRTIVRSQLLRT